MTVRACTLLFLGVFLLLAACGGGTTTSGADTVVGRDLAGPAETSPLDAVADAPGARDAKPGADAPAALDVPSGADIPIRVDAPVTTDVPVAADIPVAVDVPPDVRVPPCEDRVVGPGETDVDCGGDCAPCAIGLLCRDNADCRSGICTSGRCAAPASCDDGAKNGGESDVDCGGPCRACATGRECGVPADCLSETCLYGLCRDPSCTDEVHNGSETDVDCGGPCDACADGRACGGPVDCLSGRCTGGTCTSCSDRRRNGDETDVDCGGPCPDCADGRACGANADCVSGRCAAGTCSSCSDRQRNGNESDVDCGGACPDCADGRACGGNGDCDSARCTSGECTSCWDEARNGGESDVDCGGPCYRCSDGESCGANADCTSGRCTSGRCTSCADDLRNGGETDVDCGGPCPDCTAGATCTTAGDCASGRCEGGHCCTPNACGVCGALPTETCNGRDDDCDGATDEPSDLGTGARCPNEEGACDGARAACRGAAGWVCDEAAFEANDSRYEPVEVSCDWFDNDCDGTYDEGDVCNICNLPHPPIELGREPADRSFNNSPQDWLVVLDDAVEVLLARHWDGDDLELHHVEDAEFGWSFRFNTNQYSNDHAAIIVGGGTIHAAVDYFTGWMDASSYIGLANIYAPENWQNLGDDLAVITYAADAVWLLHGGDDTDTLTLSRREGPADWTSHGTVPYAMLFHDWRLAVQADGTAFVGHVENWGRFAAIVVRRVGGNDVYACGNYEGCESPVLRVGPDDTLHLLYATGFAPERTVIHRTLSGTTWSAPETIDEGYAPNLVFDADGTMVVSYLRDGTHLWVARSTDGATWEREPVWTLVDGTNVVVGRETAIGLDTDGRIHLAVEWQDDDEHIASYALHCFGEAPACRPDCSGRTCGEDGCGGACGYCEAGERCAEGLCVAPGECGYDAARTCYGKCGYNYSGWCGCAPDCRYGIGCCPDYDVCCD